MRDVHLLWDTTGLCLKLVAKQPRIAKSKKQDVDIQATLEMNRKFLEMHGHATACAAQFNKILAQSEKTVKFVDA